MKTKVRKVWSLIIALIVAGLMTVGYIFAWLVDRLETDLRIRGLSEGAYFDSGNGSEETPFVIANPTHMHNFAVLQNMGRFVDENGNPKKYYFEIKKTVDRIDMSGTDYEYIPPIGNDENPFIGDFNGNGKTIANFTVTTDKVKLETGFPLHAAADYEFSNAVGLFGMTGEDSNIHNVILETPKVEVASTNTKYSDGANTVVGFAVGHVAGMCQSVGVLTTSTTTTELDVKREVTGTDKGYSTFNSILGELASNVMTSVTGSAGALGSGGSGNAFGATFDVDGMYDRLIAIEKNNKSATPAWRLPELGDSSSEGITLATHEKLPFTVTSESTYEGADAAEVIGESNIGYMVGNQNKVYNKNVKFGDKLIAPGGTNVSDWHFPDGSTPATTTAGKDNKTIPRWIYKITAHDVGTDTYNDYTGFSPLSDAEYNSLSEDLLELIPSENGTVEGFNSIRLSQTYQNAGVQIYPGSTSNGQWSPHGQISWMGNTYGEGFTMTDYSGDAVDENGIKYTKEGYKIDENGFMYSEDGYFTSTEWPLPNAYDEEGYLIEGGERFLDADGEPVKFGGYDLGHDGSGYYLIKEDGTPLEWDKGWGRNRVKPRAGETVEFFRFEKGIALPNCGIWFKPSRSGKIRFVMYAEKAGNGFTLIKGTRTNATKDNPFYVDYSLSGDDVLTEEVAKYTMPSWVLFYFEFEVKQEDLDAGNVEYWLMQYGSGGAYFVYLDMGASAADRPDDTYLVDETKVSAVDFIYDGVQIEQDENSGLGLGNFIVASGAETVLYNPSKTIVFFKYIQTALQLAFTRLNHDEDVGSQEKTIKLNDGITVDSNVMATYPDYVIPGNITMGTLDGVSGGTGGGGGGTVTPNPDPNPNPDDPDTPTTSTTTSVNFKEIYDAADASTEDSSNRRTVEAGTTHGNFTFSGGKISENAFNNQGNSFTVTLNGTINSIILEGKGASGSGAQVSIIIKDESGNIVGESTQKAASGEDVDLTVNNLSAGTYTVSVEKTDNSGGSVNFSVMTVTESNSGSGNTGGDNPNPDPNPDPDPNPSGESVTESKTSGWATYSSGDTILTGNDEQGNTVFTVNADCDYSLKDSGGHIQAGGGNNASVLKFTLKKGYSYTITINAGSSGSGSRKLTFNGTTNNTGASTDPEDCIWEIEIGSSAADDTVVYNMEQDSNIRIYGITIVATPIS